MRVLVACEESQVVCAAFRAKGHLAFSCDLIETSGSHPEWHLRCDVMEVLNDHWDLIIAHPPCTYLSNAGARWLYAGNTLNLQRYNLGLQAREFFMMLLNADCDRICIENPVPSKIYALPPCTQILQPYQFGEPWSKRTCLWLKGLAPLQPTEILSDFRPYCSSGSYKKNHDPHFAGFSRKGGASKVRSRTFLGIANAMADQWG